MPFPYFLFFNSFHNFFVNTRKIVAFEFQINNKQHNYAPHISWNTLKRYFFEIKDIDFIFLLAKYGKPTLCNYLFRVQKTTAQGVVVGMISNFELKEIDQKK